MAHFPYILQAHLGIGPEAFGGAPQPPRNTNLNSKSPTTFSLNWNHCENGSAHPEPCDGVTTFMGPPRSKRAGMGVEWPDEVGSVLVFVAERCREEGWSVDIIPEDYDIDRLKDGGDDDDDNEDDGSTSRKRQKTEGMTLREKELAYIRSNDWNFESIRVYDSAGKEKKHIATFGTMSLDNPWLHLSCLDAEVSGRIREMLGTDYQLAKFPHVKEELPAVTQVIDIYGDYRLEMVTGSGQGDPGKESTTTLFSLYFRDASSSTEEQASSENPQRDEKVIAKALCSYQNSEMNSVGPTLELIETAKEWRQHGYGESLMRSINSYYCGKFESFTGRVLFSVCHVTNFHAGKWFMSNHSFRDLDGMGEELGKYLCADEYEGIENESDNASY